MYIGMLQFICNCYMCMYYFYVLVVCTSCMYQVYVNDESTSYIY